MYLHKLALLLLSGLVFASGLFAQERPFQFGFTAGVPLTDGLRANPDSSKRYTLGALGEYRFTDHISLFVNPLYRRTGSDYQFSYLRPIFDNPNESTRVHGTIRSHHLDLPIMGRYTFLNPDRKWRPFFAMGFSLNTSWRETKSVQTTTNNSTGESRTDPYNFNNRTNFYTAAMVGAGIDYRFARFHVLPEFRYSYHGSHNADGRKANQVDFLLSFRF